jgi:DNA-binding XRE family transcriptional regulator
LRARLDLMSDFPSVNRTIPEWEEEVGAAFRQFRIDADYGQSELADRANVSRSAVQALERGSGSRLATVIAVLRALDRLDALNALLPEDGPTPLEALAEAKRASASKRSRKSRS